jgi:hypothetical protein
MDAYFSADVETDGPIPGPYSMLSFALVYAGSYDGKKYQRPSKFNQTIYRELRPISDQYELDALKVNGLDRLRLCVEGIDPVVAMTEAAQWVEEIAEKACPVLVAYPLSFDWSWLYWYFVRYSACGSPFGHSRCLDIKTAFAVKAHLPVSESGRSSIPSFLRPLRLHTHHAIDDAVSQAEIFANIFEWRGENEPSRGQATTFT